MTRASGERNERGTINAISMIGLALLLAATPAPAQNSGYPNKPIRLIVQFPPGGGSDMVARMIAQRVSETLGQQIVVDNRAGGGGMIGAETAAHAAPDGHTLLFVSASYAVTPSFYKMSYDPVHGVTAIALVANGPYLFMLQPAVPAGHLKELIALAKAKPGELNFASTGVGSSVHLGMELFKIMAGVNIVHIPYKGTGPALTDLLGGQVQMLLGSAPATVPHIKSGKLRALGVTTLKRIVALPDVPTISEAGVPGYEVVSWYGILGPKGVPKDIVGRWNTEVNRITQMLEIKQRFGHQGIEAAPLTPDVFTQFLKRDVEKWKKVVKDAGVKGE